jgi:hypothetical protein
MRRAGIAATFTVYMVTAAVGQSSDLMDERTGKWTDRGLVANTIAAAQVSEMRCGLKGQISAALRKADEANMHFNLNDKVDFSDVLFLASNIMGSVNKPGSGWDAWCKKYRESFSKLINSQ